MIHYHILSFKSKHIIGQYCYVLCMILDLQSGLCLPSLALFGICHGSCVSYTLCCYGKIPKESILGRGGLAWLMVQNIAYHGEEVMAAGASGS